MISLRCLFLLLLALAGAWCYVQVCSRLYGVNMAAVLRSSLRQRNGWIMIVLFVPIYLVCFWGFQFFATQPIEVAAMLTSSRGGLVGYQESDGRTMLYDPVAKEYQPCAIGSGQWTADTFDRVFEAAAIYKPFLSDTYEDIWMHDPCEAVFYIMVGLIGLVMLTPPLYDMAKKDAPRPLSLAVVRENCKAWTGFSWKVVLAAPILYVLLLPIVSTCVQDRLIMGYVNQIKEVREDLRSDVLSRVAPGKVLRGRVINRLSDSGPVEGKARAAAYTVEFKRMAQHEPVYLRLTVEERGAPSPDFRVLDDLFPAAVDPATLDWQDRKKPVDADFSPELDFRVNDDLSVSLVHGAREGP